MEYLCSLLARYFTLFFYPIIRTAARTIETTIEHIEERSSEDSGPNTPAADPELKCMCGLIAKKRIARTQRNWLRPFFNCPKEIGDQCHFFQWEDELHENNGQHFDESNSNCGKCYLLRRRVHEIQDRWNDDRVDWNTEKMELETQISTLQSELDQIKNRIKLANETENMPPIDNLSNSDDEANDVLVKHMV